VAAGIPNVSLELPHMQLQLP